MEHTNSSICHTEVSCIIHLLKSYSDSPYSLSMSRLHISSHHRFWGFNTHTPTFIKHYTVYKLENQADLVNFEARHQTALCSSMLLNFKCLRFLCNSKSLLPLRTYCLTSDTSFSYIRYRYPYTIISRKNTSHLGGSSPIVHHFLGYSYLLTVYARSKRT